MDTTLIRALVQDETGNPISDGTVVLFSATSGVLRYSQLTTLGGIATTVLIAPTTSGIATVRADVGNEVFSTLEVPLNPGAPSLVTVTPDADTLTADGMSGVAIHILVTDAYQNPILAGQTISLTASLGTIPATVATNANGEATVTYTTGMSPGTASIGATCGGATGYGTIVLVRTLAASVDLSVSPPLLTANGSSTASLVAVILDAQNRSISDGTPVTFHSVYGTLSGGAGPSSIRGGVNGRTQTKSAATSSYHRSTPAGWGLPHALGLESTFTTTTQGGTAVATLTSATIVATDTVRVDVDNIWDSKTILYIAGDPTIILVEPAASSLPADGHSTTSVLVTVSDAYQNRVSAGHPISLDAVLGTVFPMEGVTNNTGQMSTTFTVGTQAGNATVTATCGIASGTESIQLTVVPFDTILIAITPPTVLADGLSGAVIRAVVYDVNGYPVPGATVHFELDRTLGTLSESETTTDSTGTAYTNYLGIASAQDENLHVHAWTTGAPPIAEGWQNLVLRGITVSGQANPGTIIADGVSTSQITVHVFETTSYIALGNQVVTFGSSIGSIPNQGITNSSGLVTVTLTSGTQPGVAQVAARFGNTLTDTVDVTMVESTPTYLSLTANPTVILADNSSTSVLTAVVTDQSNNPVPNGTRIHFEVPPNSGSLESSRPTVNGVATNTLTSSSTPDTVLIRAWVEDSPSVTDSTTVIYIVGPPQVVLLAAQYDTLLANGIATDTISATVTDAVGHPLSNIEVHFTTNRGNITNSQRTNDQGIARVPFFLPPPALPP